MEKETPDEFNLMVKDDEETPTEEWELWEKEFDSRYITGDFGDIYEPADRVPLKAIKSFIRSLLSSRDTYWKERVLAIIEKHDPSTNRETSPAYWGNTLREEIKSLR